MPWIIYATMGVNKPPKEINCRIRELSIGGRRSTLVVARGGGGGGGGAAGGESRPRGEEEEMGGRENAVDYLCVNGRRCGRRPLV